jgi:hypothetical protein
MPFHTLLEKPIKPTIYKKDRVNGFFLSALKTGLRIELFSRPLLPILCSDKLRSYVYFSVRNVSAEVQIFKKKQRKFYLNVLT